MQDLEEVRAALGYEQINLYGVSYGTRVAQHYMRRHPQRVRAAILDGVVPPDEALGPDIPLAAQRALDALFERCAVDTSCTERFPDLPQHFDALRERLSREPLTVQLADPLTAAPVTTTLGPEQLGAVVRLLSYADETASILPLLIYEAQLERRPQALAAQHLLVERMMQEQFAVGMHFAVVCSEDAPHWNEDPRRADLVRRSYMGEQFLEAMGAICADWPRGPVDADFRELLRTSTPTLLLSGGADPATPAAYARRIMPGLANAAHLVLEGQGHGQITVGCVPRLAAQFVAAGSLEALDDRCIEHIGAAPFMLSATAPSP